MNIGIAGGGSLGLLYGFYAAAAGHRVWFKTKTEEQAAEIRKHGVKMGTSTVQADAGTGRFPDNTDGIINAVKQYHLPELLAEGLPDVPVLFLQNGMGDEHLIDTMVQTPVMGVSTHGAVRTGLNIVRHTGHGCTYFAEEAGAYPVIQSLQALDDHFPVVLTEDLDRIRKKKLAANAVINPLTVLTGEKNGSILEQQEMFDRARLLYQEAADALELPMQDWSFIEEVLESTRENYSSMLVDYMEKRPLEIEEINGAVLRLAEASGRSAEEHRAVMKEVIEKVNKHG
ncbi:2-dehydropantoate 2-reductase [Alkalicoccus chagannorensis]|uniref:2-dehydropantoate 2-reductase n=1 Tax=Alkalicoccus chagannorensis TaxID=427072 RepID=UPI00041ABA4C|nr:2-dehydropantoate 2-reductase [Alkalicoccus chagannorensis]